MGNIKSQLFDQLFKQHKTEHLLLALTKLRAYFHFELAVLGIEGFLLGYYLVNIFCICRENLEQEKVICSKCPLC